MDRVIEDKELGRLVVRDNVRAKRLVFRTKADAIYISIPLGVTMREVKEAIEKLRPRLLDSSNSFYSFLHVRFYFNDDNVRQRSAFVQSGCSLLASFFIYGFYTCFSEIP